MRYTLGMPRFAFWRRRRDDRQQEFSASSASTSSRYYSMQMAIDSGIIDTSNATREAALRIPAVLRGRNMICGISTLRLQKLDTRSKPVNDPLLRQIDPNVPNVVTLASTVEDLLMDGVGWWEILARGALGHPTSARHVDSRRVSLNPPADHENRLPSGIDPRAVLYVDGKPKNARNYLRFDSPNPPILVAGATAIDRAARLEQAALMYAEDPRMQDYFTPGQNAGGMDEAKIRKAVGEFIRARRKRATGYVPESLEYHTVQSPNPVELQLIQQQKQAGLDLANILGVDPEDLGISTTSRTYQNATDRRQDRVNDVLSAYMRAITDRLDMEDMTRPGYRNVFDLDDYMRADPKTRWETHKIAKDLGATDVAEIRAAEDWPERPDLNVSRETPAPPAPENGGKPVSTKLTKFDGPAKSVTLRLDDDATTFAVDAERRVIEGTALLFDVAAENADGHFTFQDGSVEWKRSAVNRVKLLRDHDWGQLLGAAMSIRAEDGKLATKFKVARGAAGDQALAEAEDGALDGLSVGLDIIDFQEAAPGRYSVSRAILHEVSLTPRPAFDDARLTSVAASNTKGNAMDPCTKCGKRHAPDAACAPDTGPAIDYTKMAEAFAAAMKAGNAPAENGGTGGGTGTGENGDNATGGDNGTGEGEQNFQAPSVNPTTRPLPGTKQAKAQVEREESPYTFDRAGRFVKGEHDFSTDFGAMLREQDFDGKRTPAGKRVMGHLAAKFDVGPGDVNELNPDIQRPDMYYEAPGDRMPLWNMVNKGAPPNGIQPFTLPKFNSASGLVGDHTPGTEPSSGTFTTTSQTITPTGLSGKVSVQREVLDMGGNPAVSNLIWRRMLRSWDEAKEAATATFLNTLTAATDVTLPGGATTGSDALVTDAIKALVVSLNFLPSYDWDAFALEQQLYTKLAEAKASDGRPIFPQLGGTNVDGGSSTLWQRLNLGGLVGTPAPGLPGTAGTLNNSWLFDREVVHGYATAPQRFEFAGTDTSGDYAPVAMVDIAIWGYKAFANIDIAGVRQVTYDSDLDDGA